MYHNKLEVEWKILDKIANYYGFPNTVFFLKLKDFPKGKLKLNRRKKLNELRKKLINIIDDIMLYI